MKLANLFWSKERGMELNIIVNSRCLIQFLFQASKFNVMVLVNLISCTREDGSSYSRWTQVNHFQRMESITIHTILLFIQGTEMLSNEPYSWEAYSCCHYQKLHLMWSIFCQPCLLGVMKYRGWEEEDIIEKFNHTEIQFR